MAINIRTIRKVMDNLGYNLEEKSFVQGSFIHNIDEIRSMRFNNAEELVEYLAGTRLPFDVNIEDEQAAYVDETIRGIHTPVVKRIDSRGVRLYYTNEIGYQVFCSGTNFVSKGLPEDHRWLMKYRENLVKEGKDPDEELKYAATFGTIMHFLYAEISKGADIPMNRPFMDYLRRLNIKHLRMDHVERIISDNKRFKQMQYYLVTWKYFCNKYNVKPLFIEKMLTSTTLPVGTPLDFYCEMDYEYTIQEPEYYKRSGDWGEAGTLKGYKKVKQTKRVRALMDFKSGDSTYEKYFYQLDLGRMMMQENYGDKLPVDYIFNFLPMDPKRVYETREDGTRVSKLTPTFQLKDWMDDNNYETYMSKREHVYALATKQFNSENYYIEEEVDLVLNINSDFDIENLTKKVPVIDFLTKYEL